MKTLYIILAFCAGLFLGHLIFPTEKDIKPPSLVELKKTETKLQTIDSTEFESKVHFLQQNDSLKKRLEVVGNLLSFHKSLLSVERKKVAELTNRIRQDTICKGDSVLVDSLYSEIADLNTKTDSLITEYDRRDSIQEKLVAIRDSQIAVCEKSYQEAKDLILEQEKREQQLTEDLNVALKELKRKRWQNRLLSGGILFVSGIVTTLYIKSTIK